MSHNEKDKEYYEDRGRWNRCRRNNTDTPSLNTFGGFISRANNKYYYQRI
jgi:hypothetical protein